MKESIRHWKQIVEASEQGVAVIDTTGTFLYRNHAYRQMFPIPDAITNIFEIVQPDRAEEMHRILDETLQGRITPVFQSHRAKTEIQPRALDVRVAANPFYSEEGVVLGCVLLVYDITHEMDVKRIRAAWLDMCVHELRTPLTVIRGTAQSLLHRMGKGKVISNEQFIQELQGVERCTDTLMSRLDALIQQTRSDLHEHE